MERLFSSIIFATAITLLYGSVRFWFLAIERLRRGQSIVPLEPRRPVPWGLLDLLLIFLLVIFTINGAHRLVITYWKIPIDGGFAAFQPHHLAVLMLASSLATLASCLASLALVQLRAGATSIDLGLVAADFWRDVKLGAAAFVMIAPPMYLLQIGLTQIWKYEHPVQDLLERQTDVRMLLVTLVTAVGVAPFAEEMFFRVLLQGWFENISAFMRSALQYSSGGAGSAVLQRDWRAVLMGNRSDTVADTHHDAAFAQAPTVESLGELLSLPTKEATIEEPDPHPLPIVISAVIGYLPVAFSAFIFAIMHFGQGPAPIPLFFLALGLGYVYRQTHRATPSIVVHFLINSFSMFALWVALVFKE